jgi:hypothetical protein
MFSNAHVAKPSPWKAAGRVGPRVSSLIVIPLHSPQYLHYAQRPPKRPKHPKKYNDDDYEPEPERYSKEHSYYSPQFSPSTLYVRCMNNTKFWMYVDPGQLLANGSPGRVLNIKRVGTAILEITTPDDPKFWAHLTRLGPLTASRGGRGV